MEFRVLHTSSLTEEIAQKLEKLLTDLPGIQRFTIAVEHQEFHITFDESQLAFRSLIREMSKVGCPLRSINAALLLGDKTVLARK